MTTLSNRWLDDELLEIKIIGPSLLAERKGDLELIAALITHSPRPSSSEIEVVAIPAPLTWIVRVRRTCPVIWHSAAPCPICRKAHT